MVVQITTHTHDKNTVMKNIIPVLLAACLLFVSCDNNDDTEYYDMYLAIEVVDSQGNNLLGSASNLVHQGETKVNFGKRVCYLDSQEDDRYTFRHIVDDAHSHIKIGCWWGDCVDNEITINWGEDIAKDIIIFSYDSPLNGLDSPSHDFRYPYSITINGKELELDNETGHYIYVKDIN